MTTTEQEVVNKEVDEYFSDLYGKTEFLKLIDVNKSNWQKMVNGERKMPPVYSLLMESKEELIRLKNAISVINPKLNTKKLILHLESKEREELNNLKIENDKLRSKLRMVEGIEKITNAILKGVK